MSAAAVLRSACGALRRPSSFPRAEQLFLHRSPIASRRLHSSVDKPNKLANSAVVERISDNLDSMIASCDRRIDLLKQIQENMHKRKIARRRRTLFGGVSIIIGLAVYTKNQRSKKNDTPTTTEQKMSN
ncbi:hypothetical protein EJB05_25922 [Eragrostis curvula]|uniref:Uncharacterized protein n=1 Tax=Eragrostis curvula TaxID=38414 RepID=A0A5J9UJT5_9POAL|nr:hypothetical protein EJB05_25884 [Eragrostis curvula]TVU23548.1 hypothetical protein EJB05_25922 [Eragrostis curvula]